MGSNIMKAAASSIVTMHCDRIEPSYSHFATGGIDDRIESRWPR
jgi:hypothetical protein